MYGMRKCKPWWLWQNSARYKDSDNNISELICNIDKNLPSLYLARKLRKYHRIDINNANTFNKRLFTLVFLVNTFDNIDALWTIKIWHYHNWHHDYCQVSGYREQGFLWNAELGERLSGFIAFLYSVFLIGWLMIFAGTQHIAINLLISYILPVVSLLIWSYITRKYNEYNLSSNYQQQYFLKPNLRSRYHKKIQSWNSGYNNMSLFALLKHWLLSTGHYRPNCMWCCYMCLCHRRAIQMWQFIKYVVCAILPFYVNNVIWCYFKIFTMNRTWIPPDYYDIQQDVSYFILSKLDDVILNNEELMHYIYHILNAAVANQIQSSKRKNKSDLTNFAQRFAIETPTVIKQTHLLCLQNYLKAKVRVDYNNHQSMCNHTFCHKDVCFADYQLYQQLNGYNMKQMNQKNWFKKFMAFTLRSSHKYMIPILPLLFTLNLLVLIVSIITLPEHMKFNFVLIPRFSISRAASLWLFVCLSIICFIALLIAWTMYYLKEAKRFDEITDNIKFWMDPELLIYLKNKYDKNDKFITSILYTSIESIQCYLNDIHENNIYYEALIEYENVFSIVIKLILDYVCAYKRLEIYMDSEHKSNGWQYNVDEIKKKIDEMMENVRSIDITQLNDENDICNQSKDHPIYVRINGHEESSLETNEEHP